MKLMLDFLAKCSLRFGILLLFAIVALPWHPARASDDGSYLTFCQFGPRITVVTATKKPNTSCGVSVSIQALRWKCGAAQNVETNVSKYLDQLNQDAKKECESYCSGLGSKCHGIFSSSDRCALSTNRDQAVLLGQKFGCRKDCSDGQAFTYCSLYNTGFEGPAPALIRSQHKPNCQCVSRS